ncbi:aminoacyl-tRNA hydrolase [Candidatus Dependentiae bacterium]|nr:aminoacyl-tRNA hydrolase [Candidatus Dependentiae bacterium]
METDLPIKNGIIIPGHEIEITASRSGGAGGQHVNKTSTKITLRWNVAKTSALNDEQKALVLQNLQARLTSEGDLIIHSSSSRSQYQNKEAALSRLAQEVRKALYVPKKRMKTKIPKVKKEARLHAKTRRGEIKKFRSKKFEE